jgi:hypothetical protein
MALQNLVYESFVRRYSDDYHNIVYFYTHLLLYLFVIYLFFQLLDLFFLLSFFDFIYLLVYMTDINHVVVVVVVCSTFVLLLLLPVLLGAYIYMNLIHLPSLFLCAGEWKEEGTDGWIDANHARSHSVIIS